MPSEQSQGASQAAWQPRWAVPDRVVTLMSTRAGGVSAAPWDSLNLGAAVGDNAMAVAENRRRFIERLGARPVWMRQVHGTTVRRLTAADLVEPPPQADAAWTDERNLACVVQVADCMPVLMAACDGRAVAAAHAGWRGLAAGVLEATLHALCEGTGCAPADVSVWLGPCIGPRQFEVGEDVLRAFGASPERPDAGRFVPRTASAGPRWLANLPQLARDRLARAGVSRVSGGDACTVEDRSAFFSYRRDGITGRMAAAVFIRS